MIALSVIATAIEPALVEPDLLRYAITQGGLLLVVLVLLVYCRSLHQQQMAEATKRSTEKDERLQVMVELVSDVKVALTKSLDATQLQAKSIDSLARAVEKIEDRRSQR